MRPGDVRLMKVIRSLTSPSVGVSPDSPADRGGMLVGDVVVAFDGQPVESPVDLLALLEGDRVGRAVPVRVVRGEARLDLSIVVGTRSGR